MTHIEVYKWLKKNNGEVTIDELVAHFLNISPIDIAKGFSKFVDEQIEGRE